MWWYVSWKKNKCLQKYVSEDFCHVRWLQLEVYIIQNSVKISENSVKNLEILLNLSSFFRNFEYLCSLMWCILPTWVLLCGKNLHLHISVCTFIFFQLTYHHIFLQMFTENLKPKFVWVSLRMSPKNSRKSSKKLPLFSCPNPDCPVQYCNFDTIALLIDVRLLATCCWWLWPNHMNESSQVVGIPEPFDTLSSMYCICLY